MATTLLQIGFRSRSSYCGRPILWVDYRYSCLTGKDTPMQRRRSGPSAAADPTAGPAHRSGAVVRRVVLAGGLLAIGLTTPARASNVIVNGGFDTGDFKGWNVGIRPDRVNGGDRKSVV